MAATTVSQMQKIVKDLIAEYASYKSSNNDINTEAIVDEENGHYEVLKVGWNNGRRIHGSIIHIDIVDGKIWIQHDNTSPGVALDLVQAGIPNDAIVLGFHPPHVRQHTGFAVN